MRSTAARTDYLSVEEAKTVPGLRLALSRHTPGPWGEAARNIFDLKRIPYARVSQYPGQPNEELQAWTGHNNAPIAVYGDEPPYTTWFGILLLAERLAPTPSLIPTDEAERVEMFGLCHEICGEDGLSWNRRLLLVHLWDQVGTAQDAAFRDKLKRHYGFSMPAVARAKNRVEGVLFHLARRLHCAHSRGQQYLVGNTLTAADVHCATAMALFRPLPPAQCPMDEGIRQFYGSCDPDIATALDPVLLEHRDEMYARHLSLPLDL